MVIRNGVADGREAADGLSIEFGIDGLHFFAVCPVSTSGVTARSRGTIQPPDAGDESVPRKTP
jgi:hypothetical protein